MLSASLSDGQVSSASLMRVMHGPIQVGRVLEIPVAQNSVVMSRLVKE
jgi:hypothetical protein